MKINIYYGGRGLLDDPTLYVIDKLTEVLKELRVTVEKYNIYEHKNSISTLPQTMKDADGIILATTIEWWGIGGYMQQFLDACWLYADKDKITRTYMQPVVMSTTYGEREGMLNIENAWEILGGLLCNGFCGYVDDIVAFEMNENYNTIIEKKAEDLYRAISQRIKALPTSNQAMTRSVSRTQQLELTPKESEQLSKYVSNEKYVKTQRQDVEELANMFKNLLGEMQSEDKTYIKQLKSHFVPQKDFEATYLFMIEEQDQPLVVDVRGDDLNIYYGQTNDPAVLVKLDKRLLEDIMNGKITFQRAFMTGEMTAKGNFKTLKMLDDIFIFA